MNIKYYPKNKLTDIDIFSVAFTRSKKQSHAAMLYTDTSDNIRLLHLTGYDTLKDDAPSDDFVWLNLPLSIGELEKSLLGLYCETLYKLNGDGIPYDFDYTGTGFDSEGKFFQTNPGTGLTCGTFVMSVLEEKDIHIIDSKNWPKRDDDKAWQKFVLLRYLIKWLPQKLIHRKQTEIMNGINRYRPEEIIVASHIKNQPHTFSYIQNSSLRLVKFFNLYLKLKKVNQ